MIDLISRILFDEKKSGIEELHFRVEMIRVRKRETKREKERGRERERER